MIFGIPETDFYILLVSLLAAGALTGILAGLFGVGGGAVAVPILYELFRIIGVPDDARMPLCVGTSLAIIIPTSIKSFLAHKARGAVDMDVLRRWAVAIVTGVLLGSIVARFAPESLFKIVFVVVAGFSSLRLLFGRESWRLGQEMPTGALMKAYGVMVGVLSALMGIGGGQLSSMFMTLYGRPIHQAVATSAGVGILVSIPGALGFIYAGWDKAAAFPDVAALQFPFALGYVSLLGMVLFIPTSVLCAGFGVRIAHMLTRRKLEVAFGLFLLGVGLRFLYSLFA